MRALAAERGSPVHAPESVNSVAARMVLAAYRPDLLVVCDYGQILKPEALEIARFGGINLHASLLPKYRGAAPINWAIYHGETETGVTVIHMTPQLDAGPAIAQEKTAIGPEETADELEPRLADIGAPLVLQAVAALESGTAQPIPQDARQATRAPRLTKKLGQVDWSRAAGAIANQVRALRPWPKTFTFWQRQDGEPLRMILEKVRVEPGSGGAGRSAAGCGRQPRRRGGQRCPGDRSHPAGRQTGDGNRRIPPRLRDSPRRPAGLASVVAQSPRLLRKFRLAQQGGRRLR